MTASCVVLKAMLPNPAVAVIVGDDVDLVGRIATALGDPVEIVGPIPKDRALLADQTHAVFVVDSSKRGAIDILPDLQASVVFIASSDADPIPHAGTAYRAVVIRVDTRAARGALPAGYETFIAGVITKGSAATCPRSPTTQGA